LSTPEGGFPPYGATVTAGRVLDLWRYPVKSLAGERCAELELDARGVTGDRLWALVDRDGKIASGKTTRRFRRVDGLLRHSSALGEGGEPIVQLADGRTVAPGPAVAAELAGPGWRFDREAAVSHLDAGPVHVVTTATLAGLGAADGAIVEPERLRPNVLVESDVREEEWVGRRLRIGAVELEVTGTTERCVMVGQAQLRLSKRPRLLRTLVEWNDLQAGVYASVVRPGRVRVGEVVDVV
jgi:uncharacterized protein YcbX